MISDATQGNATKFKDDIDLGVMCRSIWGSEVDFGDGVGEQPVHLLDEPEAKKRHFVKLFFWCCIFLVAKNTEKN